MKRLLFSITFILLIQTSDFAQSYGLIFSSHEVVQEKRTSLDLSPEDSLCFTKPFELSFDINFLPRHEIYFGYVCRIIAVGTNNGPSQNIDLIYNQRAKGFKVIIGENFSGIGFSVDSPRLYKEWNRVALSIDPEKHTLQFTINGRVAGTSALPVMGSCFKFLWGANDFQKFRTRDIPPMQLKNVWITEDGVLKYDWPLDETLGELVTDRISRRIGKVKNPAWLKPRYQQWELLSGFTINGSAGVAYDPQNDKLYITGADSLVEYSFRGAQNALHWIPYRHQEQLLGHQNIYDTLTGKLYDIYIDRKIVSTYDFNSHEWDAGFPPGPLTEYWHANKFISPLDTSLYVIGGYGQMRYKNGVHRYRFATRQWDSVVTSGDYLPPRYLSALGMDAKGKFAYIVGGYGSHEGDQMLDPKNYYDLFRYDVKNRSFKKIYSLKPLAYPFTFANHMVISGSDTWYGLLFANDSYNSNLQLIEGSLSDSTFRLVGNTIPYSFYDVQSFADLYYSPLSNKLIAVTLFFSKEEEKDKHTQVKIYTLNFPPEPTGGNNTAQGPLPGHRNLLYILFGGVLLLVVVVLGVRKLRNRRLRADPAKAAAAAVIKPLGTVVQPGITGAPAATGVPGTGVSGAGTSGAGLPATGKGSGPSGTGEGVGGAVLAPSEASSIYLFGPFQVFDREGHDITRLFTPLLKELFLIITTYTMRNGRGISSEGLNEILWHDKAEKDAKNNRSVNLAKLKIILEKIGNIFINKESGYWQLQIMDKDVYLDYKKFVSLAQEAIIPDTVLIHALVDIIKRGPFLLQTEYNWLDDIKSEISNTVIDRCLGYIRSRGLSENPEFIIEITNCIFYFDQLNEDALTFKCKCLILLKRHTLASNTYQKFIKDYKDIYCADFDKSFQEIIA